MGRAPIGTGPDQGVHHGRGERADLARVAVTAFGGAVLVGLGVVWAVNSPIPEFWIFGPELPFGGLGTGLTLALSGVIVWALLVYSVRHFRGRSMDEIRRSAGKKPNPATRQRAR